MYMLNMNRSGAIRFRPMRHRVVDYTYRPRLVDKDTRTYALCIIVCMARLVFVSIGLYMRYNIVD